MSHEFRLSTTLITRPRTNVGGGKGDLWVYCAW